MRTKPRYLIIAALTALLLHIFLLLGAHLVPKSQKTALQTRSKPIQVNLESPKKQLVQIRAPAQDKTPRKADFLSEFNSQVSKQTQALQKKPDSLPMKRPARPQKFAPHQKGPRLKPDLFPSFDDFERFEAPSDFNDHLDGKIEKAAETRLNTFEWKYASYFNRIKERVAQTWSPMVEIRRYDPAGALLANRDRLTVLEITIDSTGRVLKSEINKASGVFYLDDEARRAFERASPFPNPPEVLFTSKQSFSFTFGFLVSPNKGFAMDFD